MICTQLISKSDIYNLCSFVLVFLWLILVWIDKTNQMQYLYTLLFNIWCEHRKTKKQKEQDVAS